MKNTRTFNLLLLQFIVFIWGFTGILGKEITLDAFGIVWWRVLIASVAIFIFSLLSGRKVRATGKEILKFSAVGFITAAHWVCFFSSIKASNVSVALVVISTIAFFVSLISPFIRKEKFHPYEIILGILVIVGLLFIFRFESEYTLGIILSLCAAILAAVFSTINSVFITRHTATKIAFWEMLAALFGMSVFMLLNGKFQPAMFELSSKDLSMLLVLGAVCTAFAFITAINIMKVLSPFTCALSVNMEPVYTIAFALYLYGSSEWMSPQFYLGAFIIISTMFIDIWLKRNEMKRRAGI